MNFTKVNAKFRIILSTFIISPCHVNIDISIEFECTSIAAKKLRKKIFVINDDKPCSQTAVEKIRDI